VHSSLYLQQPADDSSNKPFSFGLYRISSIDLSVLILLSYALYSNRLGAARPDSTQGWARLESTVLDLTRHDSTRLDKTQLDLTHAS